MGESAYRRNSGGAKLATRCQFETMRRAISRRAQDENHLHPSERAEGVKANQTGSNQIRVKTGGHVQEERGLKNRSKWLDFGSLTRKRARRGRTVNNRETDEVY